MASNTTKVSDLELKQHKNELNKKERNTGNATNPRAASE